MAYARLLHSLYSLRALSQHDDVLAQLLHALSQHVDLVRLLLERVRPLVTVLGNVGMRLLELPDESLLSEDIYARL